MIYLFIGIGGIIGSLLRYFVSLLTVNMFHSDFPVATLTVNLTGSFLLGWFSSKYLNSKKYPDYIIRMISTGLIGSYTTFSTFSLETLQLMESERYAAGIGYLLFSFCGGLLSVQLGLWMGSIRKKEVKKKA